MFLAELEATPQFPYPSPLSWRYERKMTELKQCKKCPKELAASIIDKNDGLCGRCFKKAETFRFEFIPLIICVVCLGGPFLLFPTADAQKILLKYTIPIPMYIFCIIAFLGAIKEKRILPILVWGVPMLLLSIHCISLIFKIKS